MGRQRSTPKAFLGDADAVESAGIDPFDFVLAEKLGRTVAEIHAEMSMAEWVAWSRFYAVRRQAEELAARKG